MASTRCRTRVALFAVLVLGVLAVVCVLGEGGSSNGAPSPARVAAASREAPAGGDSDEAAAAETGGAGEAGALEEGGPSQGARAADVLGRVDGLVADAGGSAASRRVWTVEQDVSQAAGDLLDGYEARGDTTLAHAGWVDLLGSVWGCAVVGPGWVDLCFVERQGEGASRVSVLRMEVDQWEEAYGNAGLQGGS